MPARALARLGSGGNLVLGQIGMDFVRGHEHLLRLGLPVWSPGVVDVEDGQRNAFRVPEHELGAGPEPTGLTTATAPPVPAAPAGVPECS
jgi:hypothetical protein